MLLIDEIAEARIAEAIAKGDLSDLPGEGERLKVTDDPFVSEELRLAYRILKNSGFLPDGVRLRREISDINELLRALPHGAARCRAVKRLNLLRAQLSMARGMSADGLLSEERYAVKLFRRLE